MLAAALRYYSERGLGDVSTTGSLGDLAQKVSASQTERLENAIRRLSIQRNPLKVDADTEESEEPDCTSKAASQSQ